jgi:nucleoside-diphosphate-sugar epimerase
MNGMRARPQERCLVPAPRFSGQRVLVTGATGFLGSHLCRHLSQRGAEVHAVSRKMQPRDAGGPLWLQGDLQDIATARSVVRASRPEVIFHLSSNAVGAPDLALVLPTFHADLETTINVLTAATEFGCGRLMLVASLEEPMPDRGDDVPSSPYGAAKWAATMYGRMFQRLYATPVVIARVYMTYGPGQAARKLIPYVALSLLRGEAPKVSSGERGVDWVYVDDVMEGLLAAAVAPDVESSTIELGSGELVPIRRVVDLLVELTGAQVRPQFGALPDRPFEKVRAAHPTCAWRKLGWKATTPLDQGLAHTVAWYRRQLTEAPTVET